jgi:hypothetical protein
MEHAEYLKKKIPEDLTRHQYRFEIINIAVLLPGLPN